MAIFFSLKDIERLEELLAKIPDTFIPMEPDFLDGYLTALALMKNPPDQTDWIRFIYDTEGRDRARLREPEQSELKKLILKRGAFLEQSIISETPIDPIIFEIEHDDGSPVSDQESITALSGFSEGFGFACANWPELMKSEEKAIRAALVGILRYGQSDAEEAEDFSAVGEVVFVNLDEALEDLVSCVQEIAEITRARDISAKNKRKSDRH